MTSNIVPKGSLNTASAPEEMYLDFEKIVDMKLEDESEMELLRFLASQITPYSEFQSRAFVINTELTDHRKIQQIALEIRGRITGTADSHYIVKKAEIQKKMYVRDLEAETDPLKQEMIQLEIDKIDFDVNNSKLIQYQTQLEISKLIKLLKEIAPENTYETIRNYKDNWEEKEEEYWTKRFGKQSMMDILLSGKIQSGNLDSIIGMPEASQKKVIGWALLQTQKMEKGITEIGEAVRNVLIEHEKLETPMELPNITGISGIYGGLASQTVKTLQIGQDGVVKATNIKNS